MSMLTSLSEGPHILLQFKNIPSRSALGFTHNQAFQYIVPLPSHLFGNITQENAQTLPYTRTFTSPSISFPYLISKSPGSKTKWRELAKHVYNWLKDTVEERHTDEWRWAVNFFWISYVGSSPSFPFTTMDPTFSWDAELVPLAGEYIYDKSSSVLLEQRSDVEEDAMKPLSDWMDLRAQWLLNGVDARSFKRIQTKGL